MIIIRIIRIKTYGLLKLLTALLLLPLVTACGHLTDDYDEVNKQVDSSLSESACYINLTIAVSHGIDNNMTRAEGDIPTAGENGDGREAGFSRENEVTGITLILYQDADGINGNANTPLDLVKYYKVERTGTTLPANGIDLGKSKVVEAYYTTGNQQLNKGEVDFTVSYHAIVVANADLCGQVSTLGEVRDYRFKTLYNGNESSVANACTNFIMSSESDYTMNFQATTPTTYNNGLLYSFSGILIERLVARVDFWAACSNGYKSTYSTPGYEYDVDNSSDKFVVTGIMPFNLNGGNATNGGEYLIKRLADNVSASPTITYLADETGSNYVMDPGTPNKTEGELTYFKNKLLDLGTLADVTSFSTNNYYKSIANMHTAVTATGNDTGFTAYSEGSLSGENVIITYPMENTLWGSSLLYNYATGLAIEGDYYHNGTPEHRIYYGYLRHNGTSTTAYHAMRGSEMSATATSTSSNCMEYGIVRNNIYRVYISKISSDQNITINIKVKKWDKFTHDIIYM